MDRLSGSGPCFQGRDREYDDVVELGLLNSSGAFVDSLQQAREQLADTLAHDLRTPLSVAYTSLELIASVGPSAIDEMRELTRRSIKRGPATLGELLDPIRMEAGEGMTMYFGERDYRAEIEEARKDVPPIYGIFDYLNTASESNRSSGKGWGMGLTLLALVADAHAGKLQSSAPRPAAPPSPSG